MQRDIPWQQSVYTRPNERTPYQFSHARHLQVNKSFLPSLGVAYLHTIPALRRENIELIGSYPVLVLVTGKWARNVSMDAYCRQKGDVDKLPLELYDHLERLGAAAHSAECSEVAKSHRLLEYHCSVSVYEAGDEHDWLLSGVSPMLSEMVILPRLLHERKLGGIMRSFDRALRKTLRDSVIVAGGRLYKEDTLAHKAVAFDSQ